MFADFSKKQVLLLQGPLGPFFRRLADELEDAGASVTKVNFCGGDLVFYHRGQTINYRKKISAWPECAENLLIEHKIDAVFLLGDMRPYHQIAREIAAKHSIDVFVFEEGYLRPNHITLETSGVNGNSPMSSDPNFYAEADLSPRKDTQNIGKISFIRFLHTAWYYLAIAFFWLLYPRYKHHRHGNVVYHSLCYVRNGYRMLKYRIKEAKIQDWLIENHAGNFFIFPLQVHNDYQVQHSDYDRIEDCMVEVIESFAQHAPSDCMLVLKHHPADMPYRDYTIFLKQLTARLGLEGRILYVHNLHLPTLLKNARGNVVMNSTVGLSSLHHKTATKVLGRAIYNMERLTYQATLEEFWNKPGEVDINFYHQFRGWIEHNNQANGNFHRRLDSKPSGSGVRWFNEAEPQLEASPESVSQGGVL